MWVKGKGREDREGEGAAYGSEMHDVFEAALDEEEEEDAPRDGTRLPHVALQLRHPLGQCGQPVRLHGICR